MSDLPEGWDVAPVGQLVTLNPKNHVLDDTEVAFIPMKLLGTRYRSVPLYEKRRWQEVKAGYAHFKDDDVLLAKITPCFENGKAGIARSLPSGVGAGSTEYFVCRPLAASVLPEYLLAFLKMPSFLKNGALQMTGSVGHKRVPKDYLLGIELPLPPIPEQKRIADKLDTLLARIDGCRDRLDRVPKIIKQFRQSVLASATSGQLTEEWRLEKYGVQSIGRDELALAGWIFERAEQVCNKVQSGGTPKSGFVSGPGVPFLKVYNIVGQFVDFEYRPQYVTQENHVGPLSKSKTLPGDVLMNIVGPPLGKVAIVPDDYSEWNINQAITLFRPSERLLSKWIYFFLCGGDCVASVINDTRGSVGQVNISLSQCRAFEIPVPPLDEQREIVRRVEALFALADRLEARVKTARARVDTLTPATLAKAFRGELVPQDPNDEPASALLERIRAERASNPSTSRKRRNSKNE